MPSSFRWNRGASREAGRSNRDVLDKIKRWTVKDAALGPVKRKHFQKQCWHGGRGSKAHWVASRATMRKVWTCIGK